MKHLRIAKREREHTKLHLTQLQFCFNVFLKNFYGKNKYNVHKRTKSIKTKSMAVTDAKVKANFNNNNELALFC